MTNTLYQGDNLQILKSLPDASVDLIATDPPFCTQRDWGAFTDKWRGGLNEYLKFMEQRAVEMRRVLKDTGSLYLHCDPTASHYLKVMLDGVFGRDKFRNEIVWKYNKYTNNCKYFQRDHDIIFLYAKTSENVVFNKLYGEPTQNMLNIRKCGYKTIVDTLVVYDRQKARKKINSGRFKKIYYIDDSLKGKALSDVWIMSRLVTGSKELVAYPTQKPVALYERIIKASSNQGGIVLDPFAGSGTTLDAAESLGRKWIGIDISDVAIQTIEQRLRERHGLLLEYEVIR